MKFTNNKFTVVASAAALSLTNTVFAAEQTLTLEELSAIVAEQQAKITELEAGQEATTEALEDTSSLPAWIEKTSLGGYGEFHYNNLESDDSSSEKDQFDVHRFVVYIAHQYSDTVRFFSEVELEHALSGDGKPGEVELEQAYIEWDFAKNASAKAGVFLIPVGILNETHEPDTFYGVERNNVEKNIIPTTWWEGGVLVNTELAEGLSLDLGIHSGLSLDVAGGEYKIRDGREKVAEADGDSFAYTSRIKYTGIEGLELAATFQVQDDFDQGRGNSIGGNLLEAHAVYQSGAFGLKALYATWNLDSEIQSTSGKAGADEQTGYFVEPSFKVSDNLGVFARYSAWDNQAGDSAVDTETTQFDIGVNYWLTDTVVFKADYQNQSNDDDSKASDGFNLGVGWSF